MTTETRPPVAPGEPAPDFTLPAVDRPGTVSLADYRGRSPVFLALFLGLWCPFCRRSIVQIGKVESKLKALGVETLGIVATAPENARLYFKYRPTPMRLASDPEMSTHRAYGLPKPAATPEFMKEMQTTRVDPFGDFPAPLPIPEAAGVTGEAGRLHRERHRQGRPGSPVAPAQGPVHDRSRRHRPLGQHRVRHRGPRGRRQAPLGGGDPRRRPRPAALAGLLVVLLVVDALALHVLGVLEPGLLLGRDLAVGLRLRLELLDVLLAPLELPGLARESARRTGRPCRSAAPGGPAGDPRASPARRPGRRRRA